MSKMPDKPIVFRADGSESTGLGHVVRCLAMAQILKDEFAAEFYYMQMPQAIINEIEGKGFKCVRIENEEEFIGRLKENDIVVLDSYILDSHYQKRIKEKKCKLICIDDLHDKIFFADLIVNSNPEVIPSDYKSKPYTQFALGTEHALLRSSFLKQSGVKRENVNIENVLICFGGSDPKNFTEAVLKFVLESRRFKKINLVTGSAYSCSNPLNAIIKANSHIKHYQAVSEEIMLEIMLDSGVAIVPTSGIMLEALSAGCKVIGGMYINNQQLLYNHFSRSGFIYAAGNFEERQLNKALEQALEKINEKASLKFTVNPDLTLKMIKQLQASTELSVRLLMAADLELTYSWATDKTIRAHSFTTHQITKEEHETWFNNKLTSEKCVYLIFQNGQQPIGSLRFDIENGKARISYLVSPAHHGKGLGTIILYMGLHYLYFNTTVKVTEVFGEVFLTNPASVRAFRRFGFNETLNDNQIVFSRPFDN